MLRTIDYEPLTTPVSREESSSFRAAHRKDPGYVAASDSDSWLVAVIFLILIAVFALTVGREALAAIGTVMRGNGQLSDAYTALLPLIVIAVGLVVVVRTTRGAGGFRKWTTWLRLNRFAQANGLTFTPSGNADYPGAVFIQGRDRHVTNRVASTRDPIFNYANYAFTTGSGRGKRRHHWSYLALRLERSLPHMVLDSKANNTLFGLTNLPSQFRADQRLSLEGDFDKYFTLYCPKEYERDALYVFTPDLMALLIDNAAPFDVEIVDHWMFVYSTGRLDLSDPDVHRRFLGVVSTVGEKTLSQTSAYADERTGNVDSNIVAPEGRRLRRGLPTTAIALVLGFIVISQLPRLIELLTN